MEKQQMYCDIYNLVTRQSCLVHRHVETFSLYNVKDTSELFFIGHYTGMIFHVCFEFAHRTKTMSISNVA